MHDYASLTQSIRALDREALLKISGFIDALLTNAPSVPSVPNIQNTVGLAPLAQAKPAVHIAYASQTGNAQTVAEQLVELFKQQGFVASAHNIAEIRLKKMLDYGHLVVVASTHGEGEPPDHAIQFFEQFGGKRAPQLQGLKHAVIALGDSSYEQFCAFGQWIDQRLTELGSQEIVARLDCDVDYDSVIEPWQTSLFEALQQTLDQQTQTAETAAATGVVERATAKNPYPVEVIANQELCTDEADKRVIHLELDAPYERLPYQPGDSLGIVVQNPTETVDEILKASAFTGDEAVDIAKTQTTLRAGLAERLELYRLTERQLKNMLEKYPNKALAAELNKEQVSDFIFTSDWLDILAFYKKSPFNDAQDLVDLLNPQVHRLYSISSSPQAHEDEIHLTVRLRDFGAHQRLGLVSGCIDNLQSGDPLKIYIKPNKNFNLPQNPKTPLILIGAGTGIAPFRAFLHERSEQNIQEPTWLFLGEQSFRNSFLYQTEWLKLLDKGVLSELTTAFSRDKNNPAYVQDRLLEHASKLYEWISQGANIYLCGSADTLATSVHQALQQIIMDQGGMNEEAAKQQLQQMLVEGRYKRDVY